MRESVRVQPRRSTATMEAHRVRQAFSLVELLTVIFIISLLIAILIPSLNSARNAAKKVTTAKELDSIKVGLEMFKNENGPDFPQTNGYPPSFSHPPLPGVTFDSYLGQFPFLEDKPVVYGAHWLPAMLMGVDQQGYIKRSSVPRRTPPLNPAIWYTADPSGQGKPIERANLYLTPETTPTKRTRELPGRPPQDIGQLFPDWDKMQDLPVIVDSFDEPILYYVSNTSGRATNMLEKEHNKDNDYSGSGAQTSGPPYYFHNDNKGFTGVGDTPGDVIEGWDFSSTGGKHPIAVHGADLTADKIILDENRETFAHYIVDRKIYSQLLTQAERGSVEQATPLRPVNADMYLLISAGVDGKFGTTDDVSNIPPFSEQ